MKYPIVLVHGFCGYQRLFVWKMFDGVAGHLEKKGIQVLQVQVHPTKDVKHRAVELLEQIDAEFGCNTPVHLIGHSMGGLDCRFLASAAGLNQGHRIKSITTLSTPHFGTPIAQRISRWMQILAALSAWVLAFFPLPAGEKKFLRGVAEDSWEALAELTPENMTEVFNQSIKDHEAVSYLSYGASLDAAVGTHGFSPRAYLVGCMGVFDGPHDGIVPVASTKWGEYKSTLPADHATIMGLRYKPWLKNPFDHLALFDEIVLSLQELEAETS